MDALWAVFLLGCLQPGGAARVTDDDGQRPARVDGFGHPGIGRDIVGDVLDQDVVGVQLKDTGIVREKMNSTHWFAVFNSRYTLTDLLDIQLEIVHPNRLIEAAIGTITLTRHSVNLKPCHWETGREWADTQL